jgi:hypothetical protein
MERSLSLRLVVNELKNCYLICAIYCYNAKRGWGRCVDPFPTYQKKNVLCSRQVGKACKILNCTDIQMNGSIKSLQLTFLCIASRWE